jgi:hypothetical protein
LTIHEFEKIDERLSKLEDTINNPSSGLLVRQDSVDKWKVAASKIFWIAVGTGTALVLSYLVASLA